MLEAGSWVGLGWGEGGGNLGDQAPLLQVAGTHGRHHVSAEGSLEVRL